MSRGPYISRKLEVSKPARAPERSFDEDAARTGQSEHRSVLVLAYCTLWVRWHISIITMMLSDAAYKCGQWRQLELDALDNDRLNKARFFGQWRIRGLGWDSIFPNGLVVH